MSLVSKQRDITADMLKGFAILLVIVGHVNSISTGLGSFITSFHMPLFFLVAGWFFHPKTDWRRKWMSDSKRLLLPYLVVCILLLGYSFLTSCLLRHDWTQMKHVLFMTLYPQGNKAIVDSLSMPVWFLFALFWARQMMNIGFLKLERSKFLVLMGIGLVIAIGTKYLPLSLPLAFLQGCAAIVYILIGYFMNRFMNTKWFTCVGGVSMILWLVYFPYSGVNMMDNDYHIYLLDVLAAVGAVCFFRYLFLAFQKVQVLSFLNHFLAWAGRCSMGVLCVHTVLRFVGWQRILHTTNPVIWACMDILICVLITLCLQKIRITRNLFGL